MIKFANLHFKLKNIIFYYIQLLKARLSLTVVFSSIAGYFLGADDISLLKLLYLTVGGFFVTGSANGLNQILEREQDKLMERTAVRPLPKNNISLLHALIFSLFIGLLGIYLLNFINPDYSFFGLMSKPAFFGLLSIGLYVLVYTPLKQITPLSIAVGAIPGAIPFLLGFVAATNDFGIAAGTLFAIQFFWQFPHFISIVWVQEDAYNRAGFKMMFGNKKGRYAAGIALFTTILMTIISILPFFNIIVDLNLSLYGAIIILFLGLAFIIKTIKLFKGCEDKLARRIMLFSFIYLPIIQIVYVFDKFFVQ